MINNKKVLAVVPARGGSKGIPLKNIREVAGVPLVAQVRNIIKNTPIIDKAVVSTDHDEIARIAEKNGIMAPFRRPPELSGDRVGDYEYLIHALNEMERLDNCQYEVIVLLQPTSPLRKPEDVTNTLLKLVEEDWDAVWTVSETDSKAHPLKQLTIAHDKIEFYDPAGKQIIARQQLDPVYHRNGIAFAFTRDCLVTQKTIVGNRTGAYIVRQDEQISIHFTIRPAPYNRLWRSPKG